MDLGLNVQKHVDAGSRSQQAAQRERSPDSPQITSILVEEQARNPVEPVRRRYGDTRHGGANKRVTVAVDEALPFPGVSNLLSKHKMLGGGGGKVSRPCARLLTTCKMLPPSLATSALIQELSLCHRLCPTRGHCRTPSGIWHLPDPCSHTRHCGIRENRGQRLGAGQASASTSPKRTAPPTATTSARGRGDGSSRLLRHMLAWTRRGVLHMYGDKRGAQIGR